VVATTPLSPQDTERVLARLPDVAPEADPTRDFVLRDASSPPPRVGETSSTPLPPLPGPPPVELSPAGPLAVLHRAPEGDVPVAPRLAITFSQPMIATSSHVEASSSSLRARVRPDLPGRWRWVGTRTLVFEPAERFAMATEYTVEVPAGTRSAVGGEIAEATRWTFRTPPPTLETQYPVKQAVGFRPVLFAGFDQRVDPTTVLGKIELRSKDARGRVATASLRLATSEEVNADSGARDLAERAVAGRWLAFVHTTVHGAIGRTPGRDDPHDGVSKALGQRVAEIDASLRHRIRRTLHRDRRVERKPARQRDLRVSDAPPQRAAVGGPVFWRDRVDLHAQ